MTLSVLGNHLQGFKSIRYKMSYSGRAFYELGADDGTYPFSPFRHVISFWQYPPSFKVLEGAIQYIAQRVKEERGINISNIDDWVFDDWLGISENKRIKVKTITK
jgi:hypothetical protein